MADPYPLAARGVYAQPFLVNGRREFFAVNSAGEQVAVRLVARGKDPAMVIADLWDELNEADPIMPHADPPNLRLVP